MEVKIPENSNRIGIDLVWNAFFMETLIVFLFLLIAFNSNCSSAQVSESIMEEAQKIVDDLSTKYSDHDFVVIGKSPALIAAGLELSGKKVYHLPLSDFRKMPGELNKEDLSKVHAHFERFLPKKPSKPLVIVDYSQTGMSLDSAYGHIYYFYASRKHRPNLTPYAIIQKSDLASLDARVYKMDYYAIKSRWWSWTLSDLFKHEKFDSVALSPEYKVLGKEEAGELSPENLKNAKYEELMENLRKYLKSRPMTSPKKGLFALCRRSLSKLGN